MTAAGREPADATAMQGRTDPVTAKVDPAEGWQAEAAAPLGLMEALRLARAAAAELTGLPVDGIAESGRDKDGGWRVVVDVVESAARMGENDLLAAHELLFARDGALLGYSRLRRYRREDGARS